MSKTYKTDPYEVYLASPKKHGVIIEEVHYHEKGECDLNPNPLKSSRLWNNCHYEVIYTGKSICGCHLCTGFYENKWERRKERNKGKEYTRGGYVKEY